MYEKKMQPELKSSYASRRLALGRVTLFVSAAVFGLSTIGCGGSVKEDRLKTFAVEGKITVDGKPEEGVQVVFVPKDATNTKLRTARATTDKEGSYRLTTYVTADGAIPGEYAVTLQYLKLVVNKDGESSVGPNVLPEKYKKAQTTDIFRTVKEENNQFPAIDIKTGT